MMADSDVLHLRRTLTSPLALMDRSPWGDRRPGEFFGCSFQTLLKYEQVTSRRVKRNVTR